MKLHGPFRPGFKTFKSEENGNDCLLFYPCNKSNQPVKERAYHDIKAYLVGTSKGMQGASGKSTFVHRYV